jgi:DNA-directed RNA polymerase delta subunit
MDILEKTVPFQLYNLLFQFKKFLCSNYKEIKASVVKILTDLQGDHFWKTYLSMNLMKKKETFYSVDLRPII